MSNTLSTLRCALCGSGLELTQGVDEEGVTWTRQRCRCGRTDFLHIDRGELDLGLLQPVDPEEFEFFPFP